MSGDLRHRTTNRCGEALIVSRGSSGRISVPLSALTSSSPLLSPVRPSTWTENVLAHTMASTAASLARTCSSVDRSLLVIASVILLAPQIVSAFAISGSSPANNANATITASSTSGSQTSCGKQHILRSSKVVGGNDTYDGEFPWTVSVRRNDHHHCGGVIVASRWVLTAAHCVQSRQASSFVVRIGEYDLVRPDYHSKDYAVEKVVIHDNYSGIIKSSLTSINGADIALLKTKRDITMNEYAWPVCFPTLSRDGDLAMTDFAGHDAIVVGWGKRNEKSDVYSERLQKAKLSIIDNKMCRHWFRLAGRDMQINDQLICAGYRNGGKDACHGDSGGPLLVIIDGRTTVIGVVSTGIGCARPLLPGLYSRVSSYVDWIEKFTTES